MDDQALNAMRDHFKLYSLDDATKWQAADQNMRPVFERIFLAGFSAGQRSAALDELGKLDAELQPEGLKVHRSDDGSYVIADGAGWIPGSWPTLREAIKGSEEYYTDLDKERE